MLQNIFDNKIKSVEKKKYTFNKENDLKEEKNIKKITMDFIQELFTTYSPPLKPNYGTTFIDDLGEIVNIYKFKYYLEINAEKIMHKYEIEEIDIEDIVSDKGMLIGHISLIIKGAKRTEDFKINWSNKHFTNEAIVE
jgi:hypothetical protein